MHLVYLALGAIGGWAAYRWFSKLGDDTAKKDKKDSQSVDQSAQPGLRDAEELVQDPETGVFKSKEE